MSDIASERLTINTVDGPVMVVVGDKPSNIPHDKARECPQCGGMAWLGSRFCLHCRWDFDRASIPRIHPAKLLLLSVAFNALSAGALMWIAWLSFMV